MKTLGIGSNFTKVFLLTKIFGLTNRTKNSQFLRFQLRNPHPYVNPTNNDAEQKLRHPVIKRKISQQNRSTEHMHSYEIQVSLYMTSKQQGIEYPKMLNDILIPQITGKY